MGAPASGRRSPSGSATRASNVAINYVGRPEGAEETKDAIEQGVDICMKQMAAGRHEPDPRRRRRLRRGRGVERCSSRSSSSYGTVDILINNAGIQVAEDTDELDAEDFDRVLAVNLRGSFLCAQQAVRQMLEAGSGGSIVNVSSVHQLIPKPRFVGYSVSKGGMQNLTHTLALEYAARGIRVNAIGPGATVTPINRSWIDDPDKREMVESHIPMRRAGDAEEMAAATAFLLLRRGRLHHRPDAVRRRWPHAVPLVRDTWSSE